MTLYKVYKEIKLLSVSACKPVSNLHIEPSHQETKVLTSQMDLRRIPLKVRAISEKLITKNLLIAKQLLEYNLKQLTLVHFSR